MKTLESFDLKTVQADQPNSVVLSVEGNGGGAQLFGPFNSTDIAKAATSQLEDYQRENVVIYSIDEAVREFSD